jgi:hypothetical protein
MSIPNVAWAEDSPAGSDNIALGDNRIREMKTQIREVIDVDHDFPSSGSAATTGQHKQVTLQEAADIGSGAEGVPILGAQTYDGKAELTFTDEDDNDIQITSGGALDLGSGNLDNDEYITATDNAGTGSVNIIKANASDKISIGADLDLNGNNIDFATVTGIDDCLDEDDMSSNSATALATQQSIKAYVDSMVTLTSGDNGSITISTLIIKWGTTTGNSDTETVTFPTAFPASCYVVVACAGKGGVGSQANTSTYNISKTSFDVFHGSEERPARWIAIGI